MICKSKFLSTSVLSLSQLVVETEVSSKMESFLPDRLDISPLPGSSRLTLVQQRTGTIEQAPVPLGPPRETLESILVALDTEKYVLEPIFRMPG